MSQTAIRHFEADRLRLTSNYEHGYTERHSINSLERAGAPRGTWGVDRREFDGNGHRPWLLANHANRWHGVPDRQMAIGTQVEAVMGAWTVRLLYRALRGSSQASEGGNMVRHFPVKLELKVLHKVLRAAALRSVGWAQHFCRSILGQISANNL